MMAHQWEKTVDLFGALAEGSGLRGIRSRQGIGCERLGCKVRQRRVPIETGPAGSPHTRFREEYSTDSGETWGRLGEFGGGVPPCGGKKS